MRANSLTVTGQAKIELEGKVGETPEKIKDNAADGTYTIDGKNLKDSKGTIVATTEDYKVWTGNEKGALGKDAITFTQEVDAGTITYIK